jgi:hypothetical protein
MDAGMVKEFDSPKNLITNPDSLFHKLVKESGKSNEKKIYNVIMGIKDEEEKQNLLNLPNGDIKKQSIPLQDLKQIN